MLGDPDSLSFRFSFEGFNHFIVVCFYFFFCSFSRIGEKRGHADIDALLYLIDDFVSSANEIPINIFLR